MREYGIHVTTIPQSPTVPAFGPGRKHSLLPALAINNTLCCLLNASRPLHKGAFQGVIYFTHRAICIRNPTKSSAQSYQYYPTLHKIVQNFPR